MVLSLRDSVAKCRAGRITNDIASNKRRRHTPDQIIRKLAEGNKLLGTGQELTEVCRHLEIAKSTWHRWPAQCGGMKANDAKRLKDLEAENALLKNWPPTRPSISTCSRKFSRETSDPERRACAVVDIHRSTMRLSLAPETARLLRYTAPAGERGGEGEVTMLLAKSGMCLRGVRNVTPKEKGIDSMTEGLPTTGMRFHARAERVYAVNIGVLKGIRLLRPIWLLTAMCTPGIGAAAITLAFAGMSSVPALCLAISIPAFAWGLRYASRKPIACIESIAYIAYCDVVITVGVCVVIETGVAFLKLVWLAVANTYAFAFHGRVAMATQALVTALATALTIGGAMVRGDSSAPALITTVATVVMVNAVVAWAVYAGMSLFAEDVRNKNYIACHDELTGLLNRRGLQQACEHWVGETADKHVVAAVIDLDGFKLINDNQGHHVGDKVLRQTAQKLRALAGPDTWLARLGGDEFCVIAVADSGATLNYQQLVEHALNSDGTAVDASVGVVSEALSRVDNGERTPLTTTIADLLVKADGAMYAVKRSGRSRGVSLIERRTQ